MRIKSSFHDYYDGVQSQGQDQSLLYLRFPREVELKERLFPWTNRLRHWGYDIIYNCHFVGFCGKVYPVLGIHHPTNAYGDVSYCYSTDDVDDFVQKKFKPKSVERYFSKPRRYVREAWDYSRHSMIETFFDECAAHSNQYEYLFQENHCPIFVYREHRDHCTIVYNGRLKDLQFYRFFTPFAAFQEIQMYLGGMAFPNKPIPVIPDKIMAEIKGFDKYSFRKGKQ